MMGDVIVKASDKPLRQVANVRELLVNKQAMDQLGKVAAKHMNPERMMRVMANAVRTTPKLAECDPMSLLGALMNCAALGLEPNTPLGHAYLIPFKNKKKNLTEVQLIVGYKGFADMARRSGQVRGMHADVVYSDDELWSYEYGSNMHLRHKPGPRAGKKLGAYCHVTLEDGQAFVYLPASEILRIRDQSQNWRTAVQYGTTEQNLWHPTKHEDRMWAKTAVRALANRGEMPLSIEMTNAIEQDEAAVDYRTFATNPDDGLTIDGEIAQDDGEMVEHDDPPPAEQKPAQVEQKRTAPKEEAKEPVKEKVEKVAAGDGENPGLPLDDPKPTINARIIYDAVLADAMEVGPTKAKAAHADKIEALKAANPKAHDDLMGELAGFTD
jgi:recombination protein RecT